MISKFARGTISKFARGTISKYARGTISKKLDFENSVLAENERRIYMFRFQTGYALLNKLLYRLKCKGISMSNREIKQMKIGIKWSKEMAKARKLVDLY